MLSRYSLNIVQILVGVDAIFAQESFSLRFRCFDYCSNLITYSVVKKKNKKNKMTQTSLHSSIPYILRYITEEDNLTAFLQDLLPATLIASNNSSSLAMTSHYISSLF